MTSRRQMLQTGLFGLAAAVAAPLRRSDASSVPSIEVGPDFSKGGTPVRLLEDIATDFESGDDGEWMIDIDGVPVSIDKTEASAFVWHDGKWLPIDAVSRSGNRCVVWYDARAAHLQGKRYEFPDEPNRAWADEVVTAMFAS